MTSLIANALYEKGHEVHIASFIGGGSRPFFHIDSGIPIHYLTGAKDSFFLWRDRLRIIRLRRLYREYRPDVIIAVDAGRSRIYAPAAKGFRTVTWEHFNIYYSKNPRTRRSRRLAARYSDCIVTLTQRDAEGYLHKLKARKVVCIPNPITIDCSEPSPMTARTVLSMGRIVPQKGQDLLVRAWQRIADKAEGWKLRIVGDGPLLAEVKEYVEKNGMSGSVEFLPTTKDVQAMYRQASIYAMSSRFEGLPLVPQTQLQSIIDMANVSIQPDKWLQAWRYGVGLYVAHYATLSLRTLANSSATPQQAPPIRRSRRAPGRGFASP